MHQHVVQQHNVTLVSNARSLNVHRSIYTASLQYRRLARSRYHLTYLLQAVHGVQCVVRCQFVLYGLGILCIHLLFTALQR